MIDDDISYDIISLDLTSVSHRIPYEKLNREVEAHRIGGNILKWMRKWFTGWKQRVGIDRLKSEW